MRASRHTDAYCVQDTCTISVISRGSARLGARGPLTTLSPGRFVAGPFAQRRGLRVLPVTLGPHHKDTNPLGRRGPRVASVSSIWSERATRCGVRCAVGGAKVHRSHFESWRMTSTSTVWRRPVLPLDVHHFLENVRVAARTACPRPSSPARLRTARAPRGRWAETRASPLHLCGQVSGRSTQVRVGCVRSRGWDACGRGDGLVLAQPRVKTR